jgi:two-component system, response regulator PdtaR
MIDAALLSKPVVLVVEDEAIVRHYAVETIEEAGFVALEAANADEAVAILESRNDIRIVFTDIDMPGSMDGLKLARAVRDRWPPIKIIVTSGQRAASADDMPHGSRFFGKPYALAEITGVMRQMLA